MSLAPVVRGPARTRPFAQTCHIGGRERELLLDAFENCRWSTFRAGTQGRDVRELCEMTSPEAGQLDPQEVIYLGGKYVRMLEAMFAERMETPYAISCNSATSALVMTLGAIDLQPGDEVLVPCMSFHASATAIVANQGVPVFVEVDPQTFCIDTEDAASKITPRTRAIMVVHLGGVVADMEALLAIAQRHNLRIIEDCAQAIGARYRGREVGSLGDAGIYSLTETKSITCGEGGVVVTSDPAIARKCRLIRNHGEGAAEGHWSDEELTNIVGMNYRLTELQAAVAVAQFEQLDARNAARNANAQYLIDAVSHDDSFAPQRLLEGGERACYMLMMRYRPRPGSPSRDELLWQLDAEGIPAGGGYTRLLHELPIFARRIAYGSGGAPFTGSHVRYGTGACPRSESLNRELVNFGFINPPNTIEDMDDAVRGLQKVMGWSLPR